MKRIEIESGSLQKRCSVNTSNSPTVITTQLNGLNVYMNILIPVDIVCVSVLVPIRIQLREDLIPVDIDCVSLLVPIRIQLREDME